MLDFSDIETFEPGLPPEEILQLLTENLASSTPLTSAVTGSGAATEGPDTVSGSGNLSTTGSAAITEAHDTVSGAGTLATSGSAAIAEGPDTVVGTGSTSGGPIIGSAAITEIPDTAAGTGALNTGGSAAVAEAPDVISGAGNIGGAGSAAITEGADIAQGSGTVGYSGSAAIVETPDTVSGSGTTGGSAAIVEGHDVVAGTGGIGVTGSASIVEAPDVVAATGAQGVRFGCSTISLDACGCLLIEESACFVKVNFIDEDGDPFVPTSAQYRLDDVASATQILAWTPITPLGSSVLITVSAPQNKLIGRPLETHQCVVQLVDGYGNVDNVRVTWEIVQVVGLPN